MMQPAGGDSRVTGSDLGVGRVYVDDHGRQLEITSLHLGDRLGREIIGLLSDHPKNGHTPRGYSCDQAIFDGTWRPADV